jgi:membrane-anchored protein YejM (alkaline phosphatase superfamily)
MRSELQRWWGLQLLTTILFALIVAGRYYGVADLDDAPGSLALRAIMLVAHFGALSAIFLAPSLLAIWLRAPAWIAIPLGVLSSIGLLTALLIDTQVYQLYRFHINAGVMNLLLGGAAAETFEFSGSMYAQAAAVALTIIAVASLSAFLLWRYARRTQGRPRVAWTVTLVLIGAIVSFHGVHVWADAQARGALLEQTDVLPLRYAATAKRALRKLGVDVLSHPLQARSPSEGRNLLAYPLSPLQCQPTAARPNVVFIVIDSWRADALDARVTPNLDAFARRSVRFMDHQSGGNATRIGLFSLFYSIPGTYWHHILAEQQGPVFVTELLKQGYDVHAFRSAPLFSPEFDRTVFVEVNGVRMRSDGRDAAERDADLTEDFLSFLQNRTTPTPFFALLFYDSTHKMVFPANYPAPFKPVSRAVNYLRLDSKTDPTPLHNRYRNSVHYVDGLVGRVLASLEQQGLLENSVVVVTGDHGQEFNDSRRNYWGHGSNFTKYQTGVPLLLYAPTLQPGVQRHRTTHFDVIPTLLREHFGCSEPFDTYSVGRSLFEAGGRDAIVLSEYTDFAIAAADRIAVVRKQGMQVFDASHTVVPDHDLEPELIKQALEQKNRFYRRGKAKSK